MTELDRLILLARQNNVRVISSFVVRGVDVLDIGNDKKIVVYVNPVERNDSTATKFRQVLEIHGMNDGQTFA